MRKVNDIMKGMKSRRSIVDWYQEKIFPVLMDRNLGSEEIIQERISLLSHAQGKILEIGVGTGNNLSLYPENVRSITAIDPYVRKIHSDIVEVDLKPYECEKMKFDDNSFDVVVSTFCLCSVADLNKTLQEVRRVLKDGGLFLMLEHGKAQNCFLQFSQKIVNPLFNLFACGCNVNRDYFFMLKEMGFIMQGESIRICGIHPSMIAGHLYRAVAMVNKEQ